jgi:hypothetical protein
VWQLNEYVSKTFTPPQAMGTASMNALYHKKQSLTKTYSSTFNHGKPISVGFPYNAAQHAQADIQHVR